MFLFIVLAIILAILVTITALVLAVGGAGFIIIFGDVIVCVFLIGWIMKKLTTKKKRK